MKQEKPFYKKWWFWLLVFLFLLVMGNLNTQKTAPAETIPVAKATAQEDPQEAPQEEEKDPITAIIDEQGFSYSDLDVIQNNELVKISLHYDDTSWDETDFCNSCLTDYINICSKIYQIDGIEKVEYFVFVNLTDAKGNESKDKGFSMSMSKSVFDTYNWENIKYNPDSYQQIESDADIYIHPGIKPQVDFSKMYYKG